MKVIIVILLIAYSLALYCLTFWILEGIDAIIENQDQQQNKIEIIYEMLKKQNLDLFPV